MDSLEGSQYPNPDHPAIPSAKQGQSLLADSRGQVAVGTALSGRPPHRSQRAELPHWAPASGANAWRALDFPAPAGRIGVALVTSESGAVSSTGYAAPHSPWPGRFPPPAPQAAATHSPCSQASQVLSASPTSRRRSSPSCSHRIHGADLAVRARPTTGPPGFRARCFDACMGSTTTRGRRASRDSDARRVAFRTRERRRHPGPQTFAAQYPARTFPCQRFQGVLADAPT